MILAIELKKKTKRLIKFRPVFSVELLRKLIKSLEIDGLYKAAFISFQR